MEDRAIQQVAEAVLIAEIDESEAEAVIAEFLTTKAPIEKLTETDPNILTESAIIESEIEEEPSTIKTVDEELIPKILESEANIPTEPAIVESDIEEELPTIVTVDEELVKPELLIPKLLESEANVPTEPAIVESEIEEEPPTIARVDEELIPKLLESDANVPTEPAIVESEIEEEPPTIARVDEELIPKLLESDANIPTEPAIVESEIEEEPPTIARVDEELVKPEFLIPKILETDPNIVTEPAIVESNIDEEEPPTIATVDEELIEPELSVSELAKTEPEEIKLGVAHQDVRSEADVAATKFNLGKEITFEPSLADVDQGLPALPDGYGQSQIFLLPRDPNWAYAYWDVPNEHKEYLRQQGGTYLLLRVYDVTAIDMDTHPPLSMQEYECDEITREWYIPISMSDRDYIAELGYLTKDGRWLVLVRSNHIRIPPIYPTDWENDQFINVPWNKDLRGKTQFRL
ncbi:DUF4912 domain-containing protein [Planktothrix mougeotii LEGE 06226]|uniref:DUF4912 domain-containing protein n=2 Tax=Planktothrix mougeotii TaxID=54306 RepID=A0ABR9UDZ5_9CYAN|nr:DUF4912 domain-containing protein [Planktothrix mougeotii LEGE 06226]